MNGPGEAGGRPDAGALAAIGLTVVLWASAFVGIRAGLEGYGPGSLALLRFLVASAVLLAYALAVRMRPPDGKDAPAIFLVGFLGFAAYNVLLNTGELTVSAGSASLLVNTVPVFTALLAGAFLGERLRALGWVGIAVSFLGAALVAGGGEAGGLRFAPGALLLLLAAVCQGLQFVLQKPYLERYRPIEFTSYSLWAGTLFLLVFSPGLLGDLREAPLGATLSVVYLGVFPAAVAYVAWAHALSRTAAAKAASFLYLVPAVAFVIAFVWVGEVPSVLALAGGAVVVLGVALVNRRGGKDAGEKRRPRG